MKLKPGLFPLVILFLTITACKVVDQAQTIVRNTIFEKTRQTSKDSLPTSLPPATQDPSQKSGVTSTSLPIQTPADEALTSPTEETQRTIIPTPQASATSGTPLAKTPVEKVRASPAAGKKPPQSQAAEIRPPERRAELTRLSNLLGFQITDQNGVFLGKISDYIINTCETYIVYFVMDPAEDLGFTPGRRLVIPFELITINSGTLDALSKAIVLTLEPGQLHSAPAFPSSLQLIPIDWEPVVRAYWLQVARVSNLTSACVVSGGSVTTRKIAYATQLLETELRDGNHNLLGEVVEAILEPESGKLSFFVVSLQDNGGLVLVPLRVVNIPKFAMQPGNKVELVLLEENKLLLNAPRIDSVESATNAGTQSIARQYWWR